MISLPGAIISGYFFGAIYNLEHGKMAINLINAIEFSYPAFSFFVLYFTNKLFSKEVNLLLGRIKEPKEFVVLNHLVQSPHQNRLEHYF